jgi:hypothetical protein
MRALYYRKEKMHPKNEIIMTNIADKNPTKKPRTAPGYLEIIAITILFVLGAIWGYDQFLAQKVLTFDLKGYLREQTALIKAGELTEDQFKTNLDRMEARLNGENHNHVILLKDVVVRNGDEISPK